MPRVERAISQIWASERFQSEQVGALATSAELLRIVVGQKSLPVFQAGPAGAPAIVLLHPFGTDWRVWLPVASHLWEDFRVVVPDLQGHGLVDTQGVLQSIDTAADEVAAAIRHMRLGKVTLVGCSMGGTVAQSVALRHRDVVVQLGLIATFAKGGQAHANRATLAETEGVAAQLPGTLTRWFDAETLARNGPEINYIKDVLGRTPLDRWAAAWRAMAVVDNLERLPTLDIPVLTIAGGADSSTQDEMMRGFSTSIPYSRHVTLPDAMHMMILTHPAEIAADLKALADDGAHSRPESFAKGRRQ